MLNRISSYTLLLRRFSSNAFSLRTHNCGELRKSDIGKKVELYGWVLKNRFNGSFIVLHDKYGFVQARLPHENDKMKDIAASVRTEDVINVTGIVTSRGDDANPEMETGDIDVEIEHLEVLNKCSTAIPFPIIGNLKPTAETDVELRKRLTFRYFDLRKAEAQRLLHLRSNVVKKIRRCLEDELGFVEVETPTLAAHTPGGAAEFIVPTQMHGQVYSLPQSPQIYKQLLMIGQLDRYYQIARCYRDESIRGDRQPEFTQVDLELSFVSQDQIISLLEKIIVDSWPDSLASHRPTAPFQRLTFDEAMTKYGSDKPDLRIPWVFEECSNIFNDSETKAYGFVVKDYRKNEKLPSLGGLKRKFIKLYPHYDHKNLRFIIGSNEKEVFGKEIDKILIQKFNMGDDDLLVIGVTNEVGRSKRYSLLSTLGHARNYVADLLNLRSQKTFSFAWMVDFPLFVESEIDTSKLESAHHPFTAPVPEHLERLKNCDRLDSIKAQHYDLVINGNEMGGGSIRIHDAALQRHVFENVLKFPTKTLEPFLTALSLGAPPHGGFALGLDRYIACLGSEGNPHPSVREVIAFPKTKEGRCAMFSTPFEPDEEMLQRYRCSFDTEKI